MENEERQAYVDGWRDALAAMDDVTKRGSWLWYKLRPAWEKHVTRLSEWVVNGGKLPAAKLKEE